MSRDVEVIANAVKELARHFHEANDLKGCPRFLHDKENSVMQRQVEVKGVHKLVVQVDASFTTLVCAIVVLEGLGRQLDPSLDLFSVALSIGF